MVAVVIVVDFIAALSMLEANSSLSYYKLLFIIIKRCRDIDKLLLLVKQIFDNQTWPCHLSEARKSDRVGERGRERKRREDDDAKPPPSYIHARISMPLMCDICACIAYTCVYLHM